MTEDKDIENNIRTALRQGKHVYIMDACVYKVVDDNIKLQLVKDDSKDERLNFITHDFLREIRSITGRVLGRTCNIYIFNDEENTAYQHYKTLDEEKKDYILSLLQDGGWKTAKEKYEILKRIEKEILQLFTIPARDAGDEHVYADQITRTLYELKEILLSYLFEIMKEDIKLAITTLSLSDKEFSVKYGFVLREVRNRIDALEVVKPFFRDVQ